MGFECVGGDTSADCVSKSVPFASDVHDSQVDAQVFLSHCKEFGQTARKFVCGGELRVPAVCRCVVAAALEHRLPGEFHVVVVICR